MQESLNKIKIEFPVERQIIEPQEFSTQYVPAQKPFNEGVSQEDTLFEIPDTMETSKDSNKYKQIASLTDSSSSGYTRGERQPILIRKVDFEDDSVSEKSVEIQIKDGSKS